MVDQPVEALRPQSAEDFEAWVQARHDDTQWEFIAGEAHKVVSNNLASEIAVKVAFFIRLYLHQRGRDGRITGADGGYALGEERYIPDVAYTRAERQPESTKAAYNPNAPDLAVEVVSNPANHRENASLRQKVAGYLAAGVRVWVVNPDAHEVEVYAPGQPPVILDQDATLSGWEDLLPGFSLPVRDLFPPTKPETTEG